MKALLMKWLESKKEGTLDFQGLSIKKHLINGCHEIQLEDRYHNSRFITVTEGSDLRGIAQKITDFIVFWSVPRNEKGGLL